MSNIVHGLRTFEVTEDGGEKVNYEYGRLGNIGATDAEWKGSRQPVRGMYCLADDAVEIIERIVAPVCQEEVECFGYIENGQSLFRPDQVEALLIAREQNIVHRLAMERRKLMETLS